MQLQEKKSKIRKITDGKDHFDYETFKRMMEKGYYNTNLDEMKQTDIERKEFKMEQLNEILNQIYR